STSRVSVTCCWYCAGSRLMNAVTARILGFTPAGAAFAGGVTCWAPAWHEKNRRAVNDRIKARRKVGMKRSEKLSERERHSLQDSREAGRVVSARSLWPRAQSPCSRFNGDDGDRFCLQIESKFATLDLGP